MGDVCLGVALDRVVPAAYCDEQPARRESRCRTGTIFLIGAGTGKTTTVAALLALLAEQDVLAGRSAYRVGGADGQPRSSGRARPHG